MKTKYFFTFLLFCFFTSSAYAAKYMRVYYLLADSDDKGDCIYIELPNGKNVLYDGGEKNSTSGALANFLDGKIGVGGTINFMVLSHGHTDHFYGLLMALERYNVEYIYFPGDNEQSDLGLSADDSRIRNPTSGQYLSGEGKTPMLEPNWDNDVVVKVLWVDAGSTGNNNASLTLKISLGQSSFHLGGDLESGESEIADGDSVPYAGVTDDLANIDVYHVDHHGSTTSSNETFLNVMSPKYAIQQHGGTGLYATTYSRLISRKIILYRNNTDGKIILKMDDAGNYDIWRERYWGQEGSYDDGKDGAEVAPPSLPVGLTVTNQTANSVSLDWDDTAGADAYDVFRATCTGGDAGAGFDTQPGMSEAVGIYKKITASPVLSSEYTDSTIEIREDYYYRVSAIRTDYYCERRYSNEVEVIGDTFVPEAITNLVASAGDNYGEINLEWTAPHEDGTEGEKVYSYDLRYATFTLADTTAWWAHPNTDEASGEPSPGDPGSTETMTVGNLTAALHIISA